MHILLGTLLGAAAGSALVAVATAYVVGLLVAALAEGLALAALFAALRPPSAASHWLGRPALVGGILGAGALAALASTAALLPQGDAATAWDFARPFVPAVVAGFALFVLGVVHLRRLARGARALVTAAGPGGRGRALLHGALRLAARLLAAVAFGAALIVLIVFVWGTIRPAPGSDLTWVDSLLFGALGSLPVAALGAGMAALGRPRVSAG